MDWLAAVLAASLVGSLHCAGMCGGLVAFYSAGDASPRAERWRGHAAYHLVRVFAYAGLGAVAGALGEALDFAGKRAGYGEVAALLAGGLMLLWGGAMLAQANGAALPRWGVSRNLGALFARVLRRGAGRAPLGRAALLGLSSAVLPCGWLYSFAVVAAGTGSAAKGALVMVAFWAGTVPALLGIGVGLGALSATLRAQVPRISATVLIVLGFVNVLSRHNLPAFAIASAAASLSPAGAAPAGAAQPQSGVAASVAAIGEPPCHHPK